MIRVNFLPTWLRWFIFLRTTVLWKRFKRYDFIQLTEPNFYDSQKCWGLESNVPSIHWTEATSLIGLLLLLFMKRLAWNVYIDSVCVGLTSEIFVLRSMAKFCSIEVLIMDYHGLIYSHFTQDLLLWDACTNNKFLREFSLKSDPNNRKK